MKTTFWLQNTNCTRIFSVSIQAAIALHHQSKRIVEQRDEEQLITYIIPDAFTDFAYDRWHITDYPSYNLPTATGK